MNEAEAQIVKGFQAYQDKLEKENAHPSEQLQSQAKEIADPQKRNEELMDAISFSNNKLYDETVRLMLNDICSSNKDATPRQMIEIGYKTAIVTRGVSENIEKDKTIQSQAKRIEDIENALKEFVSALVNDAVNWDPSTANKLLTLADRLLNKPS